MTDSYTLIGIILRLQEALGVRSDIPEGQEAREVLVAALEKRRAGK